jgi:transketolase C-terminal domain/subunit
MRKRFSELSKEELKNNKNSYVLLGDIGVGGFLDNENQLVEQAINMGIAEQSMISFASGLSVRGGNIIVHTITAFLLSRAFEQIKLSTSYNQNKLILIGANGPYDYNKLGPTHHSVEDVTLMSAIYEMSVYLPSTIEDFDMAFKLALNSANSSFIRITSRVAKPNNNFYIINERWSYLRASNSKPKSTYICVGESLKYVLEVKNIINNNDIFWTFDPFSEVPVEKLRTSEVYVLEPYLDTPGTLSLNENIFLVNRKNYTKKPKYIIKKNLGWEDFE